jgi:hypothetical protein
MKNTTTEEEKLKKKSSKSPPKLYIRNETFLHTINHEEELLKDLILFINSKK